MPPVVPDDKGTIEHFHRTVREIAANRLQFFWHVVSVLAVAAYVLSLVTVARPVSHYSLLWDGAVRDVAILLPVFPIFVRARRYPRLRGAWWTMGVGLLLFSVATVVHLVHLHYLSGVFGSTPRDSVYLVSYLAIAVATALMMQQSFGPRANSVRLDGLIAGLAFGALASMYWFKKTIEVSGRPLVGELNIFNPILVMVLLVLVIAGLAPKRFQMDLLTSTQFIGFLAFFTGDIVSLTTIASTSVVIGDAVRASLPIGMCCLSLAAWPQEDRREESRRHRMSARGLNLMPVVCGALSTTILGVSLVKPMPAATSFLALGSLSLVILRMTITQGEVRELGKTNFDEARTDHVTGLANRRGFLEDGESKLANLVSTQQLGIVLIDLDGFKEVNDSIGHAYGDELLKVIGQRFANKIADRGSIARIGGDEFAYTFVIDEDKDPVTSANDLAWTLSNPVSLDGTKVRVSASIGVAIFPDHGATHAELLRSADVAMYEAKRSHGGVCVYRDEIDVNSRERLSLINELRNAIDRRRLILHFQPTRDLRTNEVHGVEALVRWEHPTLGLLYPDNFIPLAERVGLIVPLTRAVLDLAISELARLDRNGYDLRMSVNISQWDLMDERLPESIDRMLKWYDLAPGHLTLEVTESSLGQDPVRAKQSLARLRMSGIRISIDDFGVGYSSLSQLLDLPVDELKIDKSFVLALESDERAISLIRSTVDMARALGLLVVAEGVENAVNLESLRRVGTHVAQGDFISTPLTSSQLDDFLTHPAPRLLPRARATASRNDSVPMEYLVTQVISSPAAISSAGGQWSHHVH